MDSQFSVLSTYLNRQQRSQISQNSPFDPHSPEMFCVTQRKSVQNWKTRPVRSRFDFLVKPLIHPLIPNLFLRGLKLSHGGQIRRKQRKTKQFIRHFIKFRHGHYSGVVLLEKYFSSSSNTAVTLSKHQQTSLIGQLNIQPLIV